MADRDDGSESAGNSFVHQIQKKDISVFLFVPNLIGYVRIVLLVIAVWYMSTNYVVAVWCYLLSEFLDKFDGDAARYFNQCSKFGAMLDMLTDRCATMCLLVALSCFYPRWMFCFQMSSTIDIASHWLHLHSSTMKGAVSHKVIDDSGNKLLHFYYTYKPFLFFMCGGNELFYSMLYLCHFTAGPSLFGIGLWQVLCVLSAPVAILKTIISLIQFLPAAQAVVSIDEAERRAEREKAN